MFVVPSDKDGPRPRGLERLLRYCARLPFSQERLRKVCSELVYRCAKQHSEPGSDPRDKRGAKGKAADEVHLTPMALIGRLATAVLSVLAALRGWLRLSLLRGRHVGKSRALGPQWPTQIDLA